MKRFIFFGMLMPLMVCGQGFTFLDPTFNCAAPSGGVYSPATDANVGQWWSAGALPLANNDPLATTWPASKGFVGTCSSATQPIYKTGGLNGLPYVQGASGASAIDSLNANLSAPFAVTMVCRIDAGYHDYAMFFHDGNHTGLSIETGKFAAVYANAASIGAAFSVDTHYMVTWVQPDSDRTHAVIYINRVDVSVPYSDSAYSLPSSFQLFRGDSGTTPEGRLYEIVIYDPASRTAIESYFNTKYGGVF